MHHTCIPVLTVLELKLLDATLQVFVISGSGLMMEFDVCKSSASNLGDSL